MDSLDRPVRTWGSFLKKCPRLLTYFIKSYSESDIPKTVRGLPAEYYSKSQFISTLPSFMHNLT